MDWRKNRFVYRWSGTFRVSEMTRGNLEFVLPSHEYAQSGGFNCAQLSSFTLIWPSLRLFVPSFQLFAFISLFSELTPRTNLRLWKLLH